jgi:hypothetical protein
MTGAGATDTAAFLAFVTQGPLPALKQTRPDAVVVMDNLAAHKAAAARWRRPGSATAACPPTRQT